MTRRVLGNEIDVENIYIYVSDAVRWDKTPDKITSLGASFKTIAAACATMRAVSSILTGKNPPNHGVSDWTHKLRVPSLFDLPQMNTGFHNPAAGNKGGLETVIDHSSSDTLDDIEPPFIYLERDKGGHIP
ncbi:hypothetical protein G9463_17375 [Haloarcula sp. JP-Z28]|uniref:hypothetical protein n=1 Tax=Haloarcula sp. JP-Z28 TaxID=2716715 RepID=UPI00140529D8|nr:hypothetical protein [Haloarcula sp. JP-Z28]NHN65060.1 hypothetical protein [Haloarcula sp. JP-Z28]